jgi:hypothetical protein
MESALGNESEHVPAKTSRFAVSDKQKLLMKKQQKHEKTEPKLGSART